MNSSRVAVLLSLLSSWAPPAGAGGVIKFATLAPEGTNAMKLMEALNADVQKRTGGKVSFKLYPGGRQGDERDMVRKIRLGQLHSGGFTGVGLGEIAPAVRILDAPALFKDYAEVDHVYRAFGPELEKAFEAKGFVLLGWTEVGFIYLFAKEPVGRLADLRRLKAWVWEGDPIAEAAYQSLGLHPIPLSITDVNTSLQTGLIDAVYNSPLYAIAMQWHEKTRHILALPLAYATGAVLISKKSFDSFSPEERSALRAAAAAQLGPLNALTRAENQKSMETLQRAGLKLSAPASPADVKEYEEAGRRARRGLVGRLYPADLLERVEASLAALRAKPQGLPPGGKP